MMGVTQEHHMGMKKQRECSTKTTQVRFSMLISDYAGAAICFYYNKSCSSFSMVVCLQYGEIMQKKIGVSMIIIYRDRVWCVIMQSCKVYDS